MNLKLYRLVLALGVVSLFGCGSGSNSSSNTPPIQSGNVQTMVSDAATEDWATVGVHVLSISLTPQSGGAPVTVYTAPTPVPLTNLVQLDQLSDLLQISSVPAGNYSSATVTLSANPGDVVLIASADPEPGFAAAPGATISSSQIQIVGATGSAGSQTVSLNLNLVSPLIVAATQNIALDIEFDLSNPTLIVAHVPPSSGQTLWAVDFKGPVRHRPVADITRFVLRHLYGNVNSVSADNTSITITKDYPTEPATNPETPLASTQALKILADSTNGTIFYDLDAKTTSTIFNFSSQSSSLSGKYVRVAARYQAGGNLVAVRIWASSSFNRVWVDPEGHVLHVNTSTDVLTIEKEDGTGLPLSVNSSTQFFFRTPSNAQTDAQPIGTGIAFLSNVFRGFKVHVMVVDPLASPMVAQVVDIEIARFDGAISSPTNTGFTYTRKFNTASDNYTITLPYISTSTPNGNDPLSGSALTGFKWWNFTFPTVLNSGANAVSNFISATNGSVNFGGSTTPLTVAGASYATWNDPANPNNWSTPWAVLLPTPVPLGTVAASWTSNSTGGSFTMTVAAGSNAVAIDVTSTTGSATLAFQVDRTNGIITISPQDLTTSAGLNNVASNLTSGVPVKVFGVPQASGHLKAYVLFYFTGTAPIS